MATDAQREKIRHICDFHCPFNQDVDMCAVCPFMPDEEDHDANKKTMEAGSNKYSTQNR